MAVHMSKDDQIVIVLAAGKEGSCVLNEYMYAGIGIRFFRMIGSTYVNDYWIDFHCIHALCAMPQCRGNIIAASGAHYQNTLGMRHRLIRQSISGELNGLLQPWELCCGLI